MPKKKPYNPGFSEKAWDDIHLFIAKMQIKHAKKLAELEKQMKEHKEEKTSCPVLG